MRTIKHSLVFFILVLNPAFADGNVDIREILSMIPGDKDVMPCTVHVNTTKITKAVIPMTPYRGLNLIFPFKLFNESTIYALSSTRIWKFDKANGTNVVPVTFTSFNNSQWGTVHDLTIVSNGFTFTLTLKADIANHCTNIVFDLSEEEQNKIIAKEKKQYLEVLRLDHEKALGNLDKEAKKKSLALLGTLALTQPDSTGVHEEGVLELNNGDEIVGYVDKILTYDGFSVLSVDLENDSDEKPLFIKSVKINTITDGRTKGVNGEPTFKKRLDSGESQLITFSTLEELPKSGAELIIKSNRGELKVKW